MRELLASAFVACLAASAAAYTPSSWARGAECFNAGDFACAFDHAEKLLVLGQMALSEGPVQTDSMAFYERAFLEHLVRAEPETAKKLAERIDATFSHDGVETAFLVQTSRAFLLFACLNDQDLDCLRESTRTACAGLPNWKPPLDRGLDGVGRISDEAWGVLVTRVVKVAEFCRQNKLYGG